MLNDRRNGHPAGAVQHRLADNQPGHQNHQDHQQADDQFFPYKLRLAGTLSFPVQFTKGPPHDGVGDAVLAHGKGGKQGPVADDVDQPGDAVGVFEDGPVGACGECQSRFSGSDVDAMANVLPHF